jgi:hypothetical protein
MAGRNLTKISLLITELTLFADDQISVVQSERDLQKEIYLPLQQWKQNQWLSKGKSI